MCWSKNVSLGLTIFGFTASYYSYYFIDKLWSVSVFYFTSMQLIHYLGYTVIDKCDNKLNQAMSYSNYIHASFQPYFYLLGFYGLFKKYNIINKSQLLNLKTILNFSLIPCILYLLRLVPMKISKRYNYDLQHSNGIWNGKKVCSYSGKKHINFMLPLRNKPYYITPNMFFHFSFFFIPLLYYNNLTRFINAFIFISAFIPVILFNINPSESATIWCANVIFQLMTTAIIIINKNKFI